VPKISGFSSLSPEPATIPAGVAGADRCLENQLSKASAICYWRGQQRVFVRTLDDISFRSIWTS